MIRDYRALMISLALLPLSIRLFALLIPRARRWGLVDRPGGRHIHAMPIAIVGGVGVVVTWLAGLALFAALSPGWAQANARELAVTVACALAILGVGIADDSRGITPRARLLAELAIAALTVAFVPSVHEFCADLSRYLGLAIYPLATVGIAGVMNAMNLVDGMDGLAGSLFLSTAAVIAALGYQPGGPLAPAVLTPVLLVPGLLAFLRKNWHPAVTFMGDHGSLCVGYLLVVSGVGLKTSGPRHGLADLVLLSVLFSYPVLDMLICMARRLRAGLPTTTGDRNHMHHRMLRLGMSVRESVVSLTVWQVAMLSPVFVVRWLPPAWSWLALLPAIGVAVERLLLLGRIEGARIRQYQARIYGLFRPRGQPKADSAFVRVRVCIPLQPMIEAAQFEEQGCLEQMVESLRFFCERRVKGHGFVHVTPEEVIVALVGTSASAPTPDELRHEWSDALKGFTQLFKLTYSTWGLPVYVRVAPPAGGADPSSTDDAVKVA